MLSASAILRAAIEETLTERNPVGVVVVVVVGMVVVVVVVVGMVVVVVVGGKGGKVGPIVMVGTVWGPPLVGIDIPAKVGQSTVPEITQEAYPDW